MNYYEEIKNELIDNELTNIIKNALNIKDISEKYLKKLILEDLPSFMKELGNGFSLTN